MNPSKLSIAVGVTGASGAIYARRFIQRLLKHKKNLDRVGVVFSDNAKTVWEYELGNNDYKKIPFTVYEKNDFHAPFASGSAKFDALVVIPCSMGTLGRIANGTSDDLITRTADVILKERKKLILVPRDMPYNLIHIKNMERVTLAGGIICPASPSFYSKPKDIEKLSDTVVDRIIDLLGIQHDTFRWGK